MPASLISRRIDQGTGRAAADLVIRNARMLNTATGTIDRGDIAICGDVVVGTLRQLSRPARDRRRRPDRGARASSTPTCTSRARWCCRREFEQGVLPRGTTTAICDPHEIANVLGVAGIRYFLEASTSLAMTLAGQPQLLRARDRARDRGARLEVDDLLPLRAHPAALGLAEVMNFPGVLAQAIRPCWPSSRRSPAARRRPCAAAARPAAQRLSRRRHPHRPRDARELDEAREKLAKGMVDPDARRARSRRTSRRWRRCSTDLTWPRIAFCTDDRNPLEIVEEGHIDAAMRIAIAAGAPPIAVYRAASLGAAIAFGLRDRGRRGAGLSRRPRAAGRSRAGRRGRGHLRRAAGRARAVRRSQPSGAGRLRLGPPGGGRRGRAGASGARGDDTPVIGARPLSLLTDHLALVRSGCDRQRCSSSPCSSGTAATATSARAGSPASARYTAPSPPASATTATI